MIRHKWIIGLRNNLSTLAGECDSAAAIEGAHMTTKERSYIQTSLRDIVNYIDDKIF